MIVVVALNELDAAAPSNFVDYRVEFPWRRSHAAVQFFRAAAVTFNVQIFDAITEICQLFLFITTF